MKGHDFEENKVVPLISKQFLNRSHLNKLDQLTPQDIHYISTYLYAFSSSICRFSPYERGFTYNSDNGKSDEKGSRLAKPDPIYETLFSGANGRPARTVGTQVGLVSSENLGYGGNFENNSNEEELTFTLLNSFWFMIASLLQQGTDLLPR